MEHDLKMAYGHSELKVISRCFNEWQHLQWLYSFDDQSGTSLSKFIFFILAGLAEYLIDIKNWEYLTRTAESNIIRNQCDIIADKNITVRLWFLK